MGQSRALDQVAGRQIAISTRGLNTVEIHTRWKQAVLCVMSLAPRDKECSRRHNRRPEGGREILSRLGHKVCWQDKNVWRRCELQSSKDQDLNWWWRFGVVQTSARVSCLSTQKNAFDRREERHRHDEAWCDRCAHELMIHTQIEDDTDKTRHNATAALTNSWFTSRSRLCTTAIVIEKCCCCDYLDSCFLQRRSLWQSIRSRQ